MSSAERDVQLSAFPDIQSDKPVGRVLPSVFRGTNADLMVAIAPMYLDGSVLDTTYGGGKWWTRFRPAEFTHHDLDRSKGDGVSFLDLPEASGSVDTVCFDPPYIPAGGQRTAGQTAGEANFRNRFGLEPMSRVELVDLVQGGMAECARVTRRFVVAKCSDYVDGGRLWFGHLDMIEAAEACGLYRHDLIIHETGSGPGGHNIFTIKRARRHHSYLLVFSKTVERS